MKGRGLTAGPLPPERTLRFACGLILLFGVAAILVRPLLPIDETRYLGVAWEMWLRGDFLVPHINGELYSHKPPLLFWLMHAGWALFGVQAWTARMLSPLIACGCFFLVARMARILWPGERQTAAFAPLALLSLPLWSFFSSMATFDVLLTFFTLLTHVGWLTAWKERRWSGFAVAALGIGGGILSKGPVILLHTVPVLLLYRCWTGPDEGSRGKPGRLALYSFLAVLAGACIALAWAIPAGIAGGAAYREQIFHGQTAGRVMNSFAHRQPLWWYVPVLPLFVFPWLMTRTFWRRQPGRPMESGSAYCLTWALTALAGFSLVSGKQVYYPLPELPAVALWISRKLDLAGFAAPSANAPRKYALAPVAVIYALLGLFLCAAPLAGSLHLPPWTAEIKPLFGVLVVLSGLSIVVGVSPARRVPRLALATILVLLFTHTAIFSAARPTYDLSRAAFRIGLLQAAHHPVAYVGTYYDQFHFLGRLREPLEETGNPEQALAWAKEHPDGVVVTVCEKNGDLPESSLLHVQPYRGRRLAIWTSQAVVQHADIFLKLVR